MFLCLVVQPNYLASSILEFRVVQPNYLVSNMLEFRVVQPNYLASSMLEFRVVQPNYLASSMLEFKVVQPNYLASRMLEFQAMQPNYLASSMLELRAMQPNLASSMLELRAMQPNLASSMLELRLCTVLDYFKSTQSQRGTLNWFFLNTKTSWHNIYYIKLISIVFLRFDTHIRLVALLLTSLSRFRSFVFRGSLYVNTPKFRVSLVNYPNWAQTLNHMSVHVCACPNVVSNV